MLYRLSYASRQNQNIIANRNPNCKAYSTFFNPLLTPCIRAAQDFFSLPLLLDGGLGAFRAGECKPFCSVGA